MTAHTTSKFASLALGAALSITWMGGVMLGIHSASAPASRTIELPTVVIVGHKDARTNATALSTPAIAVRKG